MKRRQLTKNSFYDSSVIDKAYTAKKLLDLFYLIQSQVSQVYRQKGMIFPVICSSTLLFLSRHGPASVTEVARALEHPHQTVAQHFKTLGKLGILKNQKDPLDKRRSEYFLTETGTDQAARLELYNVEAAEVFKSLDRDLGQDLGQLLDSGRHSLLQKTMVERFAELLDLGERA
jgi:DNA-binding MarR family transcriptional regulator